MQIIISILSSFLLAVIAGVITYRKEVEKEIFLLTLRDNIKSGAMDAQMEEFLLRKVEGMSVEMGDIKSSILLLETNSVTKIEMKEMFAGLKDELIITLTENRKDILELKWSKAIATFLLILVLNAGVTIGITYYKVNSSPSVGNVVKKGN